MKPKLQLLLSLLIISLFAHAQTQIGADIIGEAAKDNSGFSVSLSSDGNILAIGAPGNTRTNPVLGGHGHVRVYEYASGKWEQLGEDIDGEDEGDQSGYSLALSSDGKIVAIGAPFNDGFNPDFSGSGHVRIYEYNTGTWVLIGEIDGEIDDGAGFSVALSSDGSVVAIGGIYNDDIASQNGVARIYENQAGVWTQVGGNIYGESANDYLGGSVSISADGSIVAIGAASGNYTRVYQRNTITGGWTQLGATIEGEQEGDGAGYDVSLSADGSILAIGSNGNDDNGINSGHVRVFEYNSGSWAQRGANINGEAAGDQFGRSVSLSSNGNIVAIGASENNLSGHARIFEYVAGTWRQRGDDIDGELAYDRFGRSISLSADGSIVAIGADGNDANGDFSGHVRVFDLSDVISNVDPEISSAIKVFPNPISDSFSVTLDNHVFKSLDIYNALGQKVMTSSVQLVDVTSLAPGSYYLALTTNEGVGVKKIIIH